MSERTVVRRQVDIDAIVSCPRFGMLRGRITDLSEAGLYVCAETVIVPLNAEVSVAFVPQWSAGAEPLIVTGKVRHQSLQGCGIVFHALEPAVRAILERHLPTMPRTPAHAYPVLRAL